MPAVLSGLFDRLREAHSRADVVAVVVTGANGKFSAGFDINEFVKQSGGGGIDSTCACLLLTSSSVLRWPLCCLCPSLPPPHRKTYPFCCLLVCGTHMFCSA